MKTFTLEDSPLPLTMPYDRLSGQGVKVGLLFGVCANDALSGAVNSVYVRGVFTLNKLTSDDVTGAGLALYWDDTNKRLTLTNTSNLFVGHSMAAAGTSATTVSVRLAGCPSKATG